MNDFASLFFQLDQTNKTNDKVEALENYLIKASPLDRLWMMALFTGRTPKRTVTSRYLKEWAIEKTGMPNWLFEETYHVIGDLAETLALILPQHPSSYQSTLSEWMITIEHLSKQSLPDKKRTILAIWDQLDPKERLVFNKVLIGGFRLGVSQNLLIRALSNVTGLDANVMAHRLMGEWHPNRIDPNFIFHSTDVESSHTRPYPFCLAYPLDIPPEDLGPCADWLIEWKWDGIRGQLVNREDFFTIWSRGEEVVNDRFPELVGLRELLPEGVVLDGEILAYRDGKVLSFQDLQQRIGRKKNNASHFKRYSSDLSSLRPFRMERRRYSV